MFIAAALAVAAAPPPASPCLNKDVRECVTHLGQSMNFLNKQREFDAALARFTITDVNGKPYSGLRRISLLAEFKEVTKELSVNHRIIVLDLDTANRVNGVRFYLKADPVMADTEAGYDETQIYRYAATILPAEKCQPMATKLGFYRFFQNIMKPKFKHGKREIEVGSNYAKDGAHDGTGPVPMCGRILTYDTFHGYDTTMISDTNFKGVYYDRVFKIR